MLQACLGLTIDGLKGEVHVVDPRLPIGIDRLWVEGLRVGEAKIDLLFERTGQSVVVRQIGRSGVPLLVRC